MAPLPRPAQPTSAPACRTLSYRPPSITAALAPLPLPPPPLPQQAQPTSAFPQPLRLAGNGSSRQLRCRVLQSPLAGVSDRIFRGLVRRWAPDALLFTEMVNATSLELGFGLQKV